MTAQIATESGVPASIAYAFGVDADRWTAVLTVRPAGTLWERVAESHIAVCNNDDGIPDNCEECGAAVHTDAHTGQLVHGFDPALEVNL